MVFCGPFLTGYYRIVPAKTGLQGGFETPPRPPAIPFGAWAIFKMYTRRCKRLSPITVRIGRTDLNAHGEPERRRGLQNTTVTAATMRFGWPENIYNTTPNPTARRGNGLARQGDRCNTLQPSQNMPHSK